MRAILLGIGVLLVAIGCGGGQPEPVPPEPSTPAVLLVDNQSWADFNVFVVWEGTRQRLGRATASTRSTFNIPAAFTRGAVGRLIQFEIDPIGARVSGITRRLQVIPGDTVDLRIPPT